MKQAVLLWLPEDLKRPRFVKAFNLPSLLPDSLTTQILCGHVTSPKQGLSPGRHGWGGGGGGGGGKEGGPGNEVGLGIRMRKVVVIHNVTYTYLSSPQAFSAQGSLGSMLSGDVPRFARSLKQEITPRG